MRKARNMPIDKELLKKALKRDCLCQVEVDRVLGLKRGTIGNIMYYGSANPKIIEALEKKFGIKYKDICPVLDDKIEGDTSDSRISASRIMETMNKTDADPIGNPAETPKPRNLISVQVDADVLAEAVKEGMKQFWQECGNDILKAFEDAIFTGNYDARRKYTSQDLTYDLHKCWNTDKGYAELPVVQATLHRKR